MKITRIETFKLKPMPLVKVFATTNAVLNSMRFAVVRIETDCGISGLGEALPAWEVTGETVDSVAGCAELFQDRERLAESDLLLGAEIDTLDKIKSISARISPADQPEFVAGNTSAKAAIEQAMLDCCARYQGISLHELLGILPAPVMSAFTCGILPVEDTLKWAEEALRRKPYLLRLKVGGAGDLDRDVAVVNEIRTMLHRSVDHVLLAADANEGFIDAQRTIDFCRLIPGSLDWLEQPFCGDARSSFAKVKAKVDTPLMADESLHGLADAELLLELGGVDYFNVKLMKTGGLLPALKIIEFAERHNIKCHIGSMVETSLGCLMGTLAANAMPGQILSTDMAVFSDFENDPWGLLAADGATVTATRKATHGTGANQEFLPSLLS